MKRFDIGVVVPLVEEFAVLKEICPILGQDHVDAINYYTLEIPRADLKVVAIVLGDMGTTPASQLTERLIAYAQPKIIILAGIAGALDNDVKLGDIVVASEVCEFQAASKAIDSGGSFAFKYSGSNWRTDVMLKRCADEFSISNQSLYAAWQSQVCDYQGKLNLTHEQLSLTSSKPRLWVGHIASGNTIAASEAYGVELRGIDRKFLAIEMEAAGVLQASCGRESPVRTLVLRGISDFADARKRELDTAGNGVWRKLAMYNAATFLQSFLRAGKVLKIIDPHQPIPSEIIDVPQPAPRATKTILIVEDNLAMQRSLEKTLVRAGYTTRTASTPEEAKRELESNGINLAILDLALPNMLGIQSPEAGLGLLKWVKRYHPQVKVIMLTACATVEIGVKAMKIGASDFVQKDNIDYESFLEKVERALDT